MVKSKRIVAALAYLSIIGVCASPCKPHTTAGPLRQLLLSPLSQQCRDLLPYCRLLLRLVVYSSALRLDRLRSLTTTTAAATTSSATPEVFCANQIYRGNALSRGYKTIGATDEQECRESCCNGNIGFRWAGKEPDEHTSNVLLEADCAHLCTKNVLYHIWQYDSVSQTCNMFSGSFSDLVTLDSDGTAVGRKMLIGA
ncbi:Protein-lysine N-methyltransferase EFM4 [Fusarium oxysporum f. sp. albedinis]|nr:Protein-lysine N-methyltransferase EFM4 [Fusarium oxysporum f. sp. albedinis]